MSNSTVTAYDDAGVLKHFGLPDSDETIPAYDSGGVLKNFRADNIPLPNGARVTDGGGVRITDNEGIRIVNLT